METEAKVRPDQERLAHQLSQAIATIAAIHGVTVTEDVSQELLVYPKDIKPKLVHFCVRHQLVARWVELRRWKNYEFGLPALAISQEGECLIIGSAQADEETGDPIFNALWPQGKIEKCNLSDLDAVTGGDILLIAPEVEPKTNSSKFDLTWFLPTLFKYKRGILEVMLLTIVLNLLALVMPLFFQAITDKVVSSQAPQTLIVLTAAVVAACIFEALLTGIRTMTLGLLGGKLDVELGSLLFRHLMALTPNYFQRTSAGESVARFRELENIRGFLTGNIIMSILDLIFSFVFVLIMWSYNQQLTLVVLATLPIYVLITVSLLPELNRRLEEKFRRSARNQTFLIESISGANTIKTISTEDVFAAKWEKHLPAYIASTLRVTNVAAIGSSLIQLTSKLVTILILYLGVSDVIDGTLTLGALIAFNMLAGQLSAPILRLSQLWSDFQQVGVSIRRLGDILSVPTENISASAQLSSAQGSLLFSNVSFTYPGTTRPALNRVSVEIEAGSLVGVVGRSGSGKSTLAKLLLRIMDPNDGQLRLDGHDISTISPKSIRRRVAYVSADSRLFNLSIAQNISITRPGMHFNEIVEVAKRANAHEFILSLPAGYETVLGEQNGGLSSGQIQRVLLARALAGRPSILILDEATNALDNESERAVQATIRELRGRCTVILIAHRRSSLSGVERVLVFDNGALVEDGNPEGLLKDKNSRFEQMFGGSGNSL